MTRSPAGFSSSRSIPKSLWSKLDRTFARTSSRPCIQARASPLGGPPRDQGRQDQDCGPPAPHPLCDARHATAYWRRRPWPQRTLSALHIVGPSPRLPPECATSRAILPPPSAQHRVRRSSGGSSSIHARGRKSGRGLLPAPSPGRPCEDTRPRWGRPALRQRSRVRTGHDAVAHGGRGAELGARPRRLSIQVALAAPGRPTNSLARLRPTTTPDCVDAFRLTGRPNRNEPDIKLESNSGGQPL